MAQGEGSYVRFQDGRRMLDFTCGIGVTGLGSSICLCTWLAPPHHLVKVIVIPKLAGQRLSNV